MFVYSRKLTPKCLDIEHILALIFLLVLQGLFVCGINGVPFVYRPTYIIAEIF